jgi:hypothetical protein
MLTMDDSVPGDPMRMGRYPRYCTHGEEEGDPTSSRTWRMKSSSHLTPMSTLAWNMWISELMHMGKGRGQAYTHVGGGEPELSMKEAE